MKSISKQEESSVQLGSIVREHLENAYCLYELSLSDGSFDGSFIDYYNSCMDILFTNDGWVTVCKEFYDEE